MVISGQSNYPVTSVKGFLKKDEFFFEVGQTVKISGGRRQPGAWSSVIIRMNCPLPELSRELLERVDFRKAMAAKGIDLPSPDACSYEEKFLTFGEGNFLRSFLYWIVDRMNMNDRFEGRGIAVQPVNPDLLSQDDLSLSLARQDCLFTTVLSGLQNGARVEEKYIVSSMSRIIPYKSKTYWKDILSAARSPALKLVFSQTTEAGIQIDPADDIQEMPPRSFPAKLTLFLYHRYRSLGHCGDSDLIILPTELNYRSGDLLRNCILELARRFKLEDDFLSWFGEHVVIANSVVDSIISGKPGPKECKKLHRELGYVDNALSIGEPYKMWVIEDPAHSIRTSFPAEEISGFKVQYVDDLEYEHQKKMRLLCGAHTAMIAPSFLIGNETVGESMKDPLILSFLHRLLYEETCRSMDIPYQQAVEYTDTVLERFRNPFIEHKLLTLSLNYTSKMAERIVPSIIDLGRKSHLPPKGLAFAFAAYMIFMKIEEMDANGNACGFRNLPPNDRGRYRVNDHQQANFYYHAYEKTDLRSKESLGQLARVVLGRSDIWKVDLNDFLDGALTRLVTENLFSIFTLGMRQSLCREFTE